MTDRAEEPESDPFDRLLHRTLGFASALVLSVLALLTFVDVVGRYLFNRPVKGAYEVIEILMGILIFTALPVITYNDRHITIDLLDAAMPRRLVRLQRFMVSAIAAIALATIAWQLWKFGQAKASYNDLSAFLRIPQAPVIFGMSFLSAVAAGVAAVLSFRVLLGSNVICRT